METRRLDYFVRIVDAGSINRAATSIGVSQPALSQQLAILESELKCKLLVRSRKGTALTDAGERLYVRAQVLLRQVEDLRDIAKLDSQQPSGLVSIGLPPTLGTELGAPLVRRVRDEFPALRLQLIEGSGSELAEQLQRGLIDIAVTPVHPAQDDIQAVPVFHQEMMIIAPARYGKTRPGPRELASLPWLVTRSPNSIRNILTTLFLEDRLQPNIAMEIESLPLLIESVRMGYGVTLLPVSALHAVSREELVMWKASDNGLFRTMYLSIRMDRTRSAATVVRDALIDLSQAQSA